MYSREKKYQFYNNTQLSCVFKRKKGTNFKGSFTVLPKRYQNYTSLDFGKLVRCLIKKCNLPFNPTAIYYVWSCSMVVELLEV